MKIAAVMENDRIISPHFGRADHYLVVTVEDGKVTEREIRPKVGHREFKSDPSGESAHEHKPEHQQGQGRGFGAGKERRHARMMAAIDDCEVVLARGMGAGIYHNLQQAGIRPILTTVADIDEAVTAYLEGRLEDHPERLH
jgi:predicted Fe-Mo cluster-binding NifX family protein